MDGNKVGEKRATSSTLKTAAAVLVGVVLGAYLCDRSPNADAQGTYEQPGVQTFRDSLADSASPKVAFGQGGTAKFSRPLEVPPLYAFDSPLDETGRQIVLVDSESKRICVYWIRQRGVNSTIELVATRNFELDLKLENFNGEGLSPGQIREQLGSARN